MTNRRTLIVSIAILTTTTIIVALFGIVPLPEYGELSSENNFDGKIIYHIEIQSENIIKLFSESPATILFPSGDQCSDSKK